jgi:hypothetical protein
LKELEEENKFLICKGREACVFCEAEGVKDAHYECNKRADNKEKDVIDKHFEEPAHFELDFVLTNVDHLSHD